MRSLLPSSPSTGPTRCSSVCPTLSGFRRLAPSWASTGTVPESPPPFAARSRTASADWNTKVDWWWPAAREVSPARPPRDRGGGGLRSSGRRSGPRLRQQDGGQGRQRRSAGRVPDLSPQLLLHPSGQVGRGAAGDERRQRHGSALPLAWRCHRRLRGRATQRRRFRGRRHPRPEHGGPHQHPGAEDGHGSIARPAGPASPSASDDSSTWSCPDGMRWSYRDIRPENLSKVFLSTYERQPRTSKHS